MLDNMKEVGFGWVSRKQIGVADRSVWYVFDMFDLVHYVHRNLPEFPETDKDDIRMIQCDQTWPVTWDVAAN